MLFRFSLVLQEVMKFLLTIGSEVDINATPYQHNYLADSIFA